ncbi:MAG: hypothetical protein JSW11_05185 [Candidatus Heimdallarchaeota archaeon]|nr:MAG: hypothetical protein JSW11_05185 [Candidatus Heimdallarchaeota archaeon]
MMPYSSEVIVYGLEGIDSDQDGKIDFITVLITNSGLVTENIIVIDLSTMNKSWTHPDVEYPIQVESLAQINLNTHKNLK